MLNKIKPLLSMQEATLTRSETIQVPWVRNGIQVTILSNHRYESGHLLSMVQHQLGDEFSAKDCTNWLLGLFRSGKAVRQVVSGGDIYDSITGSWRKEFMRGRYLYNFHVNGTIFKSNWR